jgi:hypothetical protein
MDTQSLYAWRQSTNWYRRVGKQLTNCIKTKLLSTGFAHATITSDLVSIYSALPEYEYQVDLLTKLNLGDCNDAEDILVCMKQSVLEHVIWHINNLLDNFDDINRSTPNQEGLKRYTIVESNVKRTLLKTQISKKAKTVDDNIASLGAPFKSSRLGSQIINVSILLRAYVDLVDRLLDNNFENRYSVQEWFQELKLILTEMRKCMMRLTGPITILLEYCDKKILEINANSPINKALAQQKYKETLNLIRNSFLKS